MADSPADWRPCDELPRQSRPHHKTRLACSTADVDAAKKMWRDAVSVDSRQHDQCNQGQGLVFLCLVVHVQTPNADAGRGHATLEQTFDLGLAGDAQWWLPASLPGVLAGWVCHSDRRCRRCPVRWRAGHLRSRPAGLHRRQQHNALLAFDHIGIAFFDIDIHFAAKRLLREFRYRPANRRVVEQFFFLVRGIIVLIIYCS